ncbi:SRPBCC family protein [Promicromonospora soli]
MTSGRRSSLGAVAAAAAIAATWAVRRASLRWGATDEELRMPLPGDDVLPAPDLMATRAITINAPSSRAWPWVAQLGQNRGGFYTYDWLENLVGCDIHSSNVIVPELRIRAVGDEVRLAPPVALKVVAVEDGRHLVLRGAVGPDGTGAAAPYDFTWAFVLIEHAPGSTRLIVRERFAYLAGWAAALVEPVEMVSFFMSERMLRGIRERAERPTPAGD